MTQLKLETRLLKKVNGRLRFNTWQKQNVLLSHILSVGMHCDGGGKKKEIDLRMLKDLLRFIILNIIN
jgi:hypothetical protein